jgi:hypothetical protein
MISHSSIIRDSSQGHRMQKRLEDKAHYSHGLDRIPCWAIYPRSKDINKEAQF